jgi:tetraacyldisaccharide 4'-kinase
LRSKRTGLLWFVGHWYTRSPWLLLLIPLSLLYRVVIALRRAMYHSGLLKTHRLPVPVIVVGNLVVGGTGKTPLVAWLACYLGQAGYRPGLVARGYGGMASQWPQQVVPDSDPAMVGDEAVMLCRQTGCSMAVGPDRVAAARALLEHSDCDLILSDDGLQHYALQRDIEIAVIDGVLRFGNGLCLPAGPLREPVKRLEQVDLVVANGPGGPGEYPMGMRLTVVHPLQGGGPQRDLDSFHGQSIHAIAGIGNPERFFAALRRAGLRPEEHVFPDHHSFTPDDLMFGDDRPVIMTEKDAVKCHGFVVDNCWYAPVTIEMPWEFAGRVTTLLTDTA